MSLAAGVGPQLGGSYHGPDWVAAPAGLLQHLVPRWPNLTNPAPHMHSKYILTDSNILLTLLPQHLCNTVSNVLCVLCCNVLYQ